MTIPCDMVDMEMVHMDMAGVDMEEIGKCCLKCRLYENPYSDQKTHLFPINISTKCPNS